MNASFLMCPPDYFAIEYEINPWMSLKRQADPALARAQWDTLHGFLSGELGLTVRLIEPQPGLPDMVFTANAGLARGKRFVSSNFRNKERRGEAAHFEAWFEKNGFSVYNIFLRSHFEGEGDALFTGEREAYGGYLIRSDIKSHVAVADLLDARIVSLELVDPQFYHLDKCFCPLTRKSVDYYPGAFDTYAREVIAANFPDRIEIGEEEALSFACNAVVVENYYLCPRGCGKELRDALESRGYCVREFDMSEFLKAGGAVKCLVLRLEEETEDIIS